MVVTLDLGKEVFVRYIVHLSAKILIYPAQKAQITLLIIKKVAIPIEYSDYTKVF